MEKRCFRHSTKIIIFLDALDEISISDILLNTKKKVSAIVPFDFSTVVVSMHTVIRGIDGRNKIINKIQIMIEPYACFMN